MMIFYSQDDEEPEKAGGGAVRDCEDHPEQGPGDLSAEIPTGREAGRCRAGFVSVSRTRSSEEQLLFVTPLLSC